MESRNSIYIVSELPTAAHKQSFNPALLDVIFSTSLSWWLTVDVINQCDTSFQSCVVYLADTNSPTKYPMVSFFSL